MNRTSGSEPPARSTTASPQAPTEPDAADVARRAEENLDLIPLADAYHGHSAFAPPTRTRGPSRLVPLLSQIRGYSGGRLRIDALAGLTVAALTLPSAMAYAEVAGVPVTTGLYTLIAPVLIYAFLSSTPRTVVGPEGTVALVTGAAVAPLAGGDPVKWVALVSMLAIMTGVVFLIARIAKIGWMADYLSQAVLVGYIAGVAIVLIIGQIGKLTGIPSADGNALRELWGYVTNLGAANPETLAVGLGSMVILVVMRRVAPTWPSALIVVVLGIAAAWGWDLAADGVALVGEVPSGLPPLEIPAVGVADVQSLIVPAIGIFLVSFSDAILISRAIAAKNHETVDANQELFAFGTANISAGLTAGMPIGASGSRTAVNDSMRVTSQVGGLRQRRRGGSDPAVPHRADPVPADGRPRRDHHRGLSRDHRGQRLGHPAPQQSRRGPDRSRDDAPGAQRGRARRPCSWLSSCRWPMSCAAWPTRTTPSRGSCRASTASATSTATPMPRSSTGS